MKRALKKPSDYPLFYFRLKTKAEKEALELELKKALKAVNKNFSEKQKSYSKGLVIKTALLEGLDLVRRGKLKISE